MRRNYFHFKQFSVANSLSPMPLTTDSVLIGAWCDVANCVRALDVGTGCGIIALMLSQRNQDLDVDAIDIDEGSIQEAQENFKLSKWGSRISVTKADFNDWTGDYDLIVSNPPFFTNGIKSPNVSRAEARHTHTLTLDQLIVHGRELLGTFGKLAFITPGDIVSKVIEHATFASMSISRMCEVVSVEGKSPKRIMWELTPSQTFLQRERITLRNSDGTLSEAYRSLCQEFYLD
ncbi:MAG: methyltransferase [Muribaculaceae bacterium]|nr:methyltransferase [Muribaculaceae bacterium]